MRKRTEASSAAIGVFVIGVLLLRVVSEGSPVSTESSVSVRDLPFASNLLNPCPSEPATSGQSNLVAEERRAEFAVEFYRTISDNANRYKQDAQIMLDRDVIQDCATLNVPNLPNTPSLQELQEMDGGDALAKIYFSMLVHTAHAYFIRHQHETQSNSSTCFGPNERNLARKSGELAVKQKFLACIIRMGATAMGYSPNYSNQILDEDMTQLRLCSRRALRDCQVLHSIIYLLDVIARYATLQS